MTTEKRPYLRPEARRRSLLEAARRLFAREGLAGLTIVAVAAEAGVSRRLVYEHFSDLADLYRAFFAGRVAIHQASTDEAFAAHRGNLVDAVMAVFDRLCEIPPEDQRALRVLAAGTGPRELDALTEQFRVRTCERWLPFLNGNALDPAAAGALVWTLVNALLSLSDLVARGELDRVQAAPLVRSLLSGAAGARAPAAPSVRG